jgi:membrane-associated PAP2 superfamily phosphatase
MNLQNAPALPCPRFAPNPIDAPLATHLYLPLALLLTANAWLTGGGGDFWFADLLYRWEGGHWALQHAWLTNQLVHQAGKMLSIVGTVFVLLATLRAWRQPGNTWRRPWLALLVSVALSTGLVSLLKHLTHMDCPWDLTRYGGHKAFYGLLESRHGLAASGCFPAGHASAGYAWLALYFFALAVRPRWRWPAFALGLGGGLLFGFSQQLRGAHFLSHDLWTLAVCWIVPLFVFRLLSQAQATSVTA